jgi:hypothetical protein
MNGSNPETLLEGLTEAYRAVDAAMRALDEAAPNGRDYYPQGPDAVQEATREHQLRAAKLRSVREELQELVVSVQDQIDEREARSNPRERTIREVKESRQYKAGAAAYRRLDRSAKGELGDQLFYGSFEWMDWFDDKPHPDFLRGFLKDAWSPED